MHITYNQVLYRPPMLVKFSEDSLKTIIHIFIRYDLHNKYPGIRALPEDADPFSSSLQTRIKMHLRSETILQLTNHGIFQPIVKIDKNRRMALWVIMTRLCPAVPFSICEKMETQRSVNWYVLIYTTGSPICAPELKAVNLHLSFRNAKCCLHTKS